MGIVTRTMAEMSGQVGLSIQCSRLGMKALAVKVCSWHFRVLIRVLFRVWGSDGG